MNQEKLLTAAEGATDWFLAVLPNLVAALVILFAGYLISRIAARWVGRLSTKLKQADSSLTVVLQRLAQYTIMILAIVAALGQIGIQTTSLLAAIGAIGLAIGLALKDTLSNVAAGVMLLSLRPFRNGDVVDIGDISGTVEEIGLFVTKVKSLEGHIEFIPNAQIWSGHITNYTMNGTRMVREAFGIAYQDDISKARTLLLSLIEADERFLATPEPKVVVTNLGDSAVGLEVRAWTSVENYSGARFNLIELGKSKLEQGGLTIPFPQQDIYVKQLASNDT